MVVFRVREGMLDMLWHYGEQGDRTRAKALAPKSQLQKGGIMNTRQYLAASQATPEIFDKLSKILIIITGGGDFVPRQSRGGKSRCGKFRGSPWILCGKAADTASNVVV